jgi:threonine dehydratase
MRPQIPDPMRVVADKAPAIALSFAAGKPIPTESAQTFADGIATRDPRQEAVTIIKRGAARVLRLSEDAIAEAVRAYFEDTHNVAEGAGAAPLAALLQERARMTGKRVPVILTGGNIDSSVYRRILAGETPKVG